MFQRIKQSLKDVKTISTLCRQAEEYALSDGEREPGAEHFLLSALDLSDGTARRAFERINAHPADLRDAIARQYDDALRALGFDPNGAKELTETLPLSAKHGLYRAAPSGQEAMQALAARRKGDAEIPLVGAHIVSVIAGMQHGVAARALRAMGIELNALKSAAEKEIEAFRIV
jgi:hypothetical protein